MPWCIHRGHVHHLLLYTVHEVLPLHSLMGTQQHSMVVGSPNTHSKVFAKAMELAWLFGLHLVCAWFT